MDWSKPLLIGSPSVEERAVTLASRLCCCSSPELWRKDALLGSGTSACGLRVSRRSCR